MDWQSEQEIKKDWVQVIKTVYKVKIKINKPPARVENE